jgi:hypothetical protein
MKFHEYFSQRMKSAILELRKPLPQDKTDHVRGRIHELQILLDLDKELHIDE